MEYLRKDIAEAMGRMRVTFGTRTAIRDLHTVLENGEQVVDMVGCRFSAGNAVCVLTDRRVMAVRDEFSAYRLKAARLADVVAVDYAPKVHDGLGILTNEGRIAVRRMNREDADRLVDGILLRAPDAILGVSRPSPNNGRPVFEANKNSAAEDSNGTNGNGDDGNGDDEGGPDAEHAEEYSTTTSSIPTVPAPPNGEQRQIPAKNPAKNKVPSDTELVNVADADQAVLMGVLADLHARGLLTSEELAAKIAQLSTE